MKSTSSFLRFALFKQKFIRNLANEAPTMDFDKAKSSLEASKIDVDNETKLKLYGLFKQSTTGVCSTPKPGLTDFVGRAKWAAWSSLGKMTQQDAQKQYIQTVQQLLSSSSATTQGISFINEDNSFNFLFRGE